MGEEYKDRWYDFLPWILLLKRVAFQKDLNTSPSILTYGMNPAIPGDLLRDPGSQYTPPELEELVKYMQKSNNREPIPTSKPSQTIVPEPPSNITHVYARQHKAQGLEAPYNGPFPVVSRPSRSTVQIQVGLTVKGEPRYEVRSWRDLKVAHKDPEAQDAERPRRGRKKTSVPSEPANITEVNSENDAGEPVEGVPQNQNKPPAENSNERGKRSTRNPAPNYVSAIITGPPPLMGFPPNQKCWSASVSELEIINRSISHGR